MSQSANTWTCSSSAQQILFQNVLWLKYCYGDQMITDMLNKRLGRISPVWILADPREHFLGYLISQRSWKLLKLKKFKTPFFTTKDQIYKIYAVKTIQQISLRIVVPVRNFLAFCVWYVWFVLTCNMILVQEVKTCWPQNIFLCIHCKKSNFSCENYGSPGHFAFCNENNVNGCAL